MRCAITISLVPEARGGPFVFWDDLPAGIERAKRLGFTGVEVFPRSPDSISPEGLRALVSNHQIQLAAMGTGAGWVVHRLRLTDPDASVRAKAREFIGKIIGLAAACGAPAIIGSMQGRWGDGVSRPQALDWLTEALEELGVRAEDAGVPLLYEYLNRYETNLFNRTEDAAAFVGSLRTRSVRLLCDLFHMNIEETDLANSIRKAGRLVGHVHFADSNRLAPGLGHTNFRPIITALSEIGYRGFLSAEVLPLPDEETAARQTIASFQALTCSVTQ